MPILPNVSLADSTEELPPNVTFPKPEDMAYEETEYIIGPRDVLDISILDLFTEGLETVLRRQVTHTGYIDLPQLNAPIKAGGMTQTHSPRPSTRRTSRTY